MTGQHRIVVLGAGYAGLAAARRLARTSRDATITVVDSRAEFVERVRLHQEAAGQSIRRWDLRKMLERKGIEFVRAQVSDLDPATRRVHLVEVVEGGPQGSARWAEGSVGAAHGQVQGLDGRLVGAGGPGESVQDVEGRAGGDGGPHDGVEGRSVVGGDGRRAADFDSWTLTYDTLVYALGSAADRSGAPGVAEYARSVATPEDVRALPDGRVIVVGSGSTGIELAAELAESQRYSTVVLLGADEPGAWLSARAGERIRATLTRLGVEIRSAKAVEVLPTGVRLTDGTVVEAESVVWTAGFTVPDLARRAGLAVDEHGRIRTDATLRSISHPDIYAAGDAALMAGPGDRPLRMACATAIPAGAYVARAIIARAKGTEPEPMTFRYQLQCLSLGRRDAVIQVLNADDTPGTRVIRGRTGALVKELIVRGAGMTVGLR
ncbi:NAD(P)/FAD-dependent oxidoreductase [Nocardia caishijiensis]|uniref:NADH dehydrogenase FAD-containing subunit n=1 Tax=Nocardia caishijiensis TaxID=184756 RepID=A0ABQ6YTK1_9NOCA|nr:FAD-dependent oxidoreductase [Nocardia caishijiensis]KAF0849084.1 NADH dehydrogenase FAD-containing subunit [Nocardia caishijiensis]